MAPLHRRTLISNWQESAAGKEMDGFAPEHRCCICNGFAMGVSRTRMAKPWGFHESTGLFSLDSKSNTLLLLIFSWYGHYIDLIL